MTQLHTVVLDKTGTLTQGVFKVSAIVPQGDFTAEEVLQWAALAEAHSSHPIARSILQAHGQDVDTGPIADYQEIRGQGLSITTKDGKRLLVGNDRLLNQAGVEFPVHHAPGTIVYVSVDNIFAGYLVIADEIREESREAVGELRRRGVKRILMLTGDNERTAARVASQLGLDGYYSGQLPEEKVQRLEELLAHSGRSGKIAFVGDGINDAPVITRADMGIRIGGRCRHRSRRCEYMMDDNRKSGTGPGYAQYTRKIVKQNIFCPGC